MKPRALGVLIVLIALALAAVSSAQIPANIVTQGEQVFAKSCATSYCHGVKGGEIGRAHV